MIDGRGLDEGCWMSDGDLGFFIECENIFAVLSNLVSVSKSAGLILPNFALVLS
jgi:hypothetical protein